MRFGVVGKDILFAPEEYFEASEEWLDANTGGCGPGKFGDKFVPDTIYGESIFLSCQIHDFMYNSGKTWEDKRYADRTFIWNMLSQIDDGEGWDIVRERRVMAYYQAVSHGGHDSFRKGKFWLEEREHFEQHPPSTLPEV